jgi:hypothetical protein
VQSVDVLWEKEPNSTSIPPYYYAPANGPLLSGEGYRGRHDDRDDYFKVYLGTGEHIVVDLDTPLTMPTSGNETVWLLLYDLDSNEIQRSRKWTYNPPYHLDYTAQKTGWHYIRIFTPEEFRGEEPYTLEVTYP